MNDETLPTWPTLGRRDEADYGVFRVESVERRSPRTARVGTYRVIHAPSWANVVAVTMEGEVVLVEQYRHGIDRITLEIPGGMVDPGEDAAVAAARELREETGYTGADPIFLGTVHPNPAIQSNECSSWLIEGAESTHEIQPDDGEHLRTVTVPLDDIPGLVLDGTITHSLVVCAFHWLILRARQQA